MEEFLNINAVTAQSTAYVAIGLLSAVLLHEIGHLVFGLATGYRPLVIRFMSFAVCFTEKGVKIKRLWRQGSIAQCIMAPKRHDANPRQMLFGGCCVNLAFGLTALAASAVFAVKDMPWSFVAVFSAMNFMCGTLNLSQKAGSDGDGRSLADITQRQDFLDFNDELRIVYLLVEGVSYQDMPGNLFPEEDDAEHSVMRLELLFFGYYRLIALGKRDRAAARLEFLKRHGGMLPKWILDETRKETMFLKGLGQPVYASANGKMPSSANDVRIALWNTDIGRCLGELEALKEKGYAYLGETETFAKMAVS